MIKAVSVWLAICAALVTSVCAMAAEPQAQVPQRVAFPSADGKTTLTGYLYTPRTAGKERAPAVVLMHGRAGPYSTLANGVYDATTLSQRHQMWGRLWAERGVVVLLVDSFGPRGYPQGFPRFSYDTRPDAVNEVSVRPFDAYGALAYLRGRKDVAANCIGLQGWSNGGSAALVTMSPDAPGLKSEVAGFRAALVFYPACELRGHFDETSYRPYAPVRVFHGSADEEVSPKRCTALVEDSRAHGGDIEMRLYPGATHDFDDPGRKRQGVAANAAAKRDAMARALVFFGAAVEGRVEKAAGRND